MHQRGSPSKLNVGGVKQAREEDTQLDFYGVGPRSKSVFIKDTCTSFFLSNTTETKKPAIDSKLRIGSLWVKEQDGT